MIYISEIRKKLVDGIYYYDKDWLNLEGSDEYKKEILNCIAYCKPDMYFNYLFRFIIQYDFEELLKPVPKYEELQELYLEASLKILEEQCSVLLSETSSDYSLSWRTPHINYGKYLFGYKAIIEYYIIDKPNIYTLLNIDESHALHSHKNFQQFVQNVFFISFLIAFNRIRSEKMNLDFLGMEIVPLGDREVLNVYLTPFGMTHFSTMQAWPKGELLLYFNSITKKAGFTRLSDKLLLQELNTPVLLEKDGNIYYHFKPPYYDYATDFIMEKLHRPHLSSIKVESQSSYELKK